MKKFIIIVLTILSVISCALIGWYSWIMFEAPEKIISQTFEVGEQKIFKSDGTTDKKAFIEVNLFNNVFEIKFNYMLDETQTAFYSQGLQYVLKDDKKTFDLSGSYTSVESSSVVHDYNKYYMFLTWNKYYEENRFLGNKVYFNVDKFNYMSGDDYENTLFSSNPINKDTMFKIQLGSDLYGMKLKHTNLPFSDAKDFYLGSHTYQGVENHALYSYFTYDTYNDYMACDIDYFANLIYESCLSLNAGVSQTCLFEFGDLFEYFYFNDSTKQYTDKVVNAVELAKISTEIKSYYCVNVNIHDSDMTSSTQSLFNCYKGNSNYNVDLSFDDYFIGRTLVNVDVDKFDFVESETSGSYYLSLNDKFKEFYRDYRHLVEFDIVIDLDYLESLGINFLGVKEDSLESFKIFKSETIKLVNGNIVRGVVNYV